MAEQLGASLGDHKGRALAGFYVYRQSESFRWTIGAVAITIFVLLVIAITVYCCTRRHSNSNGHRVTPVVMAMASKGPGELGSMLEMHGALIPRGSMAAPPASLAPQQPWKPAPPWQHSGRLPPGIMLAPAVAPTFQPFCSTPRPPTAAPYERLLLVSSRVANPLQLARAAQGHVAVVLYDWKNWTLQELIGNVRRVLGDAKVVTVGVVAPAGKPGVIGLLQGYQTSAAKLGSKPELAHFWRYLAGLVHPTAAGDGGRVDFIGCRLAEDPVHAAGLLHALWSLTSVPFAAADELATDYLLSSFVHNPHTGELTLAASSVPALPLYFDKPVLLGAANTAASVDPPPLAANLPPAPPPLAAPSPTLPRTITAAPTSNRFVDNGLDPGSPLQAARSMASLKPATDKPDIFHRIVEGMQQRGLDVSSLYLQRDCARQGVLPVEAVEDMLLALVPGCSLFDDQHVRAMMRAEQQEAMSVLEVSQALQAAVEAHTQVQELQDAANVMPRLYDYVIDNKQILQQVFQQVDSSGDGCLQHDELRGLVALIPGLAAGEVRFIMAVLYQGDADADGCISLDELQAVVRRFLRRQRQLQGHGSGVAASLQGRPPAGAGSPRRGTEAEEGAGPLPRTATHHGREVPAPAQVQPAAAQVPPQPTAAQVPPQPAAAQVYSQPQVLPQPAPHGVAPQAVTAQQAAVKQQHDLSLEAGPMSQQLRPAGVLAPLPGPQLPGPQLPGPSLPAPLAPLLSGPPTPGPPLPGPPAGSLAPPAASSSPLGASRLAPLQAPPPPPSSAPLQQANSIGAAGWHVEQPPAQAPAGSTTTSSSSSSKKASSSAPQSALPTPSGMLPAAGLAATASSPSPSSVPPANTEQAVQGGWKQKGNKPAAPPSPPAMSTLGATQAATPPGHQIQSSRAGEEYTAAHAGPRGQPPLAQGPEPPVGAPPLAAAAPGGLPPADPRQRAGKGTLQPLGVPAGSQGPAAGPGGQGALRDGDGWSQPPAAGPWS